MSVHKLRFFHPQVWLEGGRESFEKTDSRFRGGEEFLSASQLMDKHELYSTYGLVKVNLHHCDGQGAFPSFLS
jgi:hypothetical protein